MSLEVIFSIELERVFFSGRNGRVFLIEFFVYFAYSVTPNLSDLESRHVLKTYCPCFDRFIMLKEYIPPYIHSLTDYDLVQMKA